MLCINKTGTTQVGKASSKKIFFLVIFLTYMHNLLHDLFIMAFNELKIKKCSRNNSQPLSDGFL